MSEVLRKVGRHFLIGSATPARGLRLITGIRPVVKTHRLLPSLCSRGYHETFLAPIGIRIENPKAQRDRTLRDRRRRHEPGPVVS